MGKSDVLVRFKAETQNYDANVAKAKKQLDDFGKANFSVGGAMKQTTSMLVASASKFVGWGAAVSGALKVAKDAFFNSEKNIDDWGRTVESTKMIYEGFLTSINNGDISGFLSNIERIKNAAIEAYNAMDTLSTQQAIQTPQLSAKNTEIQRAEMMLRTGRYIAPVDGRKSAEGLKNGDLLTKEQRDKIAKNLESAMGEVANITQSQVKTATNAIEALYKEQASALGISKKDFLEATSSWENFTDAVAKRDAYWKWRSEHTTYSTPTMNASPNATSIAVATTPTPIYDDSKNPYRGYAWVKNFKDDGEMYKRITQEILKRDSAQSQLYGQFGRMYRTVNRANGISPYGGGGKSGSGWSFIPMEEFTGVPIGRSVTDVKKDLAGAQSEYENAGDMMGRLAALKMVERFQKELDAMKGEENPFAEAYAYDFQKDIEKLPQVEDKKEEKNGYAAVQSIAVETQNIVGSLESMGVEIPEGLSDMIKGIQGVSTILTSIAAICTVIQTLSAIQTARSMVPFFHRGGIVRAAGGYRVPGNFGYDAVPSLLTSGEIVMNRAQQGNIASQLSESRFDIGGVSATSYVRGEDVFLGVNNFLKRSGRGEIVTSRR
jgi:hypothetical protein